MPIAHQPNGETKVASPGLAGMRLRIKPLLVYAAIASVATSLPANANLTFILFDPPGSIATTSRSISNGSVAGYYQDNQGRYHGFVRAADGTITSVDVEGASDTYGGSIDKAGRITGFYLQAGIEHGFLRDKDGSIQTFDPPGSAGTIALSINNGAITGFFYDSNTVPHGFVRRRNGQIITFDPRARFTRTRRASTQAEQLPGFTRIGTTSSMASCALPTAASPRSILRIRFIPPR
jgi:hypothetical protein